MKKSLNVLLLFAFAISLTVWSCKPKQVISEIAEQAVEEVMQEEEMEVEMEEEEEQRECAYLPIEGKGVITKLNLSNPNEVIIKFRFEPNDKGVSRYPNVSNEDVIFNVEGSGNYPTLEWCRKNKIDKGASFDCVRYEFEGGDESCAQVYFSFTEFEGSSW
jgi:hypothetical protein